MPLRDHRESPEKQQKSERDYGEEKSSEQYWTDRRAVQPGEEDADEDEDSEESVLERTAQVRKQPVIGRRLKQVSRFEKREEVPIIRPVALAALLETQRPVGPKGPDTEGQSQRKVGEICNPLWADEGNDQTGGTRNDHSRFELIAGHEFRVSRHH